LKRLIVNADDFGLAETVDLGIVKGHKEGIVTSTTLLACGPSVEHAAVLASENPGLGVGVHLCLTRERPVTDPRNIPTIVRDGAFLDNPFSFMARLLSSSINKTEVEAELRAQIEKALSLGIRPTHLDGHQHMHVMPGIFPIVAKLAVQYHIPAVRFPVGPWTGMTPVPRALEKFFLERLTLMQRKLMDSSSLKRPDWFFGLTHTGKLDSNSLCGIIGRLPNGTSELMCHPGMKNDPLVRETGWGHGWETELAALTDGLARERLEAQGVELVNYSCMKF
jgi:predicted glycoside hydrolase/deacetylase ChbG (UPF0249 family)